MTPSYIYTALIDVLAYRFRLEQDQRDGKLTFKEDLEGALKIFDKINGAIFGVQAISDTIIMTCNSHNNLIEFLEVLRTVFISFLKKGLFIRGGVAYSRHFENGRLTYSHAIARAHELEAKNAIYPRIIVDENIISMCDGSKTLPDLHGKSLLVHQNAVWFLNIIANDNWNKIFELSSNIYYNDKEKIQKNENAFSKHCWFENYLFSAKPEEIVVDRYIEKMKIT